MTFIPIAQAIRNLPAQKSKNEPTENGSLTKSENIFLDSIGAPRLRNCADEVIKQTLKLGMILLGIRENNMPIEIEKTLLVNACRDNHGNITIKELKLAFEMAANLELDFDPHSYQNFSVLYLNELLNAYKRWSTKTYNTLRPNRIQEDETENPQWSPMVFERLSVNATRKAIQTGLEHFRSGILAYVYYIPYEWYRQLVEDEYIELDEDALLYQNKKVCDLTPLDKMKLKRGQEYVWQLFEAARDRDLYTLDK